MINKSLETDFGDGVCFCLEEENEKLKELEETRLKVLAMFEEDRLNVSGWIEWIHEGSKDAETNAQKLINIAAAAISKHCAKCINLGGCRFMKSKMPEQPLHPNCHCKAKSVSKPTAGMTAFAKCPIEKITRWGFVDPAKKRFFENNGYGIMDAYNMQAEFERQAEIKYTLGEYELGGLDNYGQSITIIIELPRRIGMSGQPLCFETGWMVYPYGNIQNATPATNLSSK